MKNIYKEEMETGKISFTIVDDLDKGDFTEALKGMPCLTASIVLRSD